MEENKTIFPKKDNKRPRIVYAYVKDAYVNGRISDKELIMAMKEMFDEHTYTKNNLKPLS